jgi:hypothetical protein
MLTTESIRRQKYAITASAEVHVKVSSCSGVPSLTGKQGWPRFTGAFRRALGDRRRHAASWGGKGASVNAFEDRNQAPRDTSINRAFAAAAGRATNAPLVVYGANDDAGADRTGFLTIFQKYWPEGAQYLPRSPFLRVKGRETHPIADQQEKGECPLVSPCRFIRPRFSQRPGPLRVCLRGPSRR